MLLEERWQALHDEGCEIWHLAPIDLKVKLGFALCYLGQT
jgi:hypothetical protein